MTIKNCKKIHWIHDRKLKHNVITSEEKKSLRTSEAHEVLFNNKILNYDHKELQNISLDLEFKKIQYNVITSERKK